MLTLDGRCEGAAKRWHYCKGQDTSTPTESPTYYRKEYTGYQSGEGHRGLL